MRRWAKCVAGLAVATLAGAAFAADVPRTLPQVTFQYEHQGVPVPQFSLTVGQDGSGVYEGKQTPLAPLRYGPAAEGAAVSLEAFRSDMTVSPATTKRIFAMAGTLKQFRVECASRAKNIADTGEKTLVYTGPEGKSECSYNFSENKTVQQLTQLMEGIAETMNEGRQLEYLHRYDRLGLDAAMQTLAEEVSAGRAVELGTIAGTLRSLAADGAVMQRVRLQASKLLSLLPPDMQRAGP